MAIIEDVDSDSSDDERIQDNPINEDSPIEALLGDRKGKRKALDQSEVAEFVEEHGGQQTFTNVLAATKDLLVGKEAQEFDLNRLERLIAIYHYLNQHATNTHNVAEEDIAGLLQKLYDAMVVPSFFLTADYELTPEIVQTFSYWRSGATGLLQLFQALLRLGPVSTYLHASVDRLALALVPLMHHASSASADTDDSLIIDWTTTQSTSIANSLLKGLLGPSCPFSHRDIAQHILLTYLKPLFQSTPHPSLHPETSRKLARDRGGELFRDNFGEGAWKGKSPSGGLGCWKVLAYVLEMLSKEDVEQIWHLLVPPLLTMLDDHEVRYRKQGIECLRVFLGKVDGGLLKKTGLDDLIQKSLSTTFSFTSSSSNIAMIQAAVSADLQLIDLLYPVRDFSDTAVAPAPISFSKAKQGRKSTSLPSRTTTRFSALCAVYQSVVINFFAYSASNIPFMTLSYSFITLLAPLLKKGCVRFLSDTLPTLLTSLGGMDASRGLSRTFSPETTNMYLSALEALCAIIQACKGTGRIDRWRGLILGGIATLWCHLAETDQGRKLDTRMKMELKEGMKDVVDLLVQDGKEPAREDAERIRTLNVALFADLVPDSTL